MASPLESTIAAGVVPDGTMKGEGGGDRGAAKQRLGQDLAPHPARRGCQKVTGATDAAAAEGWIGSVTLPKV